MDNNNNNSNIINSIENISKLYDNQTYWDMYGVTAIMFILLTLFVFFVYTYLQVIQQREKLVNDWANQRCNPKYIPFAGYITRPEGKSAFEYTNENFQYCVQNILVNITGDAVNPLQYVINNLTKVFKMFELALQQIRLILSLLRARVGKFTDDVLNRVFNIMMPLQSLFIALMDTFNKIQGVMTASLYTILGSYVTLQSLMGAILELTIKLLVVLSIIVIGLWTSPFTWPAAASASAVFLSISVPLAIIIGFMTEVLQIKSSAIPRLRRCFDKNTYIKMCDGGYKAIQNIEVGEILENGDKVTAKIKVNSQNLRMFNLKGIIVSETHLVQYDNKWIQIYEHPEAFELNKVLYREPFLYCLNTSSKEIHIDNIVFADWDEIHGEQLDKLINYIDNNYLSKQSQESNIDNNRENNNDKRMNIHRYLDKGFEKVTPVYLSNNMKAHISDIKVGDKLSTQGVVYGIVELETSELDTTNINNHFSLGTQKLYHLLVSNQIFETDGKIFRDYNDNLDFICHMLNK